MSIKKSNPRVFGDHQKQGTVSNPVVPLGTQKLTKNFNEPVLRAQNTLDIRELEQDCNALFTRYTHSHKPTRARVQAAIQQVFESQQGA